MLIWFIYVLVFVSGLVMTGLGCIWLAQGLPDKVVVVKLTRKQKPFVSFEIE
jgi:hypothetical protein